MISIDTGGGGYRTFRVNMVRNTAGNKGQFNACGEVEGAWRRGAEALAAIKLSPPTASFPADRPDVRAS
jgi:hypothetical protein